MQRIIMLMDLHWGAISPVRMEQELNATLFKFLDENKVDVILLGGDLFDSKQYFTSEIVRYVIRFLDKLLKYCDTIICIGGTKTHDDLQLETLKEIYDGENSKKIHFITSVTPIRIGGSKVLYDFDSTDKPEDYMDILCIPEEYMIDQDEFYKPYLSGDRYYDMILFHGMIDKIWYAKKSKEEQNLLTKHSTAPVFKVNDLLKYCNKCYAGHVHVHKHYGQDNRFLYIGPYTRWEFGKDDDVGFEYVEFCNDQFKDSFIVNHNAQILTTRVMNINETISLIDLNDKLDDIIAKEMVESDKLRFIINIKSTIENYLGIKDFIISKLGEIKFVKLILSIDIDDSYMEDTKDVLERTKEEKKYLFETMELEERIRVFLKQKKGLDVSIEDIKTILNMEV